MLKGKKGPVKKVVKVKYLLTKEDKVSHTFVLMEIFEMLLTYLRIIILLNFTGE